MTKPAKPPQSPPPAQSYLLDTNTLLGQATPAHHNSAVARPALAALVAQGARLCVTPQVLIEFYAVATRERKEGGLGWKPEGAAKAVAAIAAQYELLPDRAEIFIQWQQLAATYKPKGKRAHDTRLAAVALAHGVSHILTANVKDFKRFAPEGLMSIDPASIVAASTPNTAQDE